jgi:hypothetical protein
MTVSFPRIEVLIMQKKPKCTFFSGRRKYMICNFSVQKQFKRKNVLQKKTKKKLRDTLVNHLIPPCVKLVTLSKTLLPNCHKLFELLMRLCGHSNNTWHFFGLLSTLPMCDLVTLALTPLPPVWRDNFHFTENIAF